MSSSGVGGDDEEEGVAVPCPSGPLGCLHFYLSYDINSKSLIVRIIEARDLPKPIQLDSSKTDQAHSNPYIKVRIPHFLTPFGKESIPRDVELIITI